MADFGIGEIAALVLSATGSAVSATAAIGQGQAAKSAADANASAQRQTAISAENSAAIQASDKQLATRKLIATQVASAGAGGIDPSTGTPLTIEGQTAQMGELDSLRIINNAQRTAWGYNTQANIDEFQGSAAQTAGMLNAGGTLLSSNGNTYFSGAKAGLWGSAPASTPAVN
jgi:hypothetical protein